MTTMTNRTTGTADTERERPDAARPSNHDWWVPLCGEVGYRAKRRLQRLGRDSVYAADQVIVEEGARADRFVLIIHGRVEVLVGDDVVATLREGDHFGEVAMLYSRPQSPEEAPAFMPRTATVRTTRTTRVREFDRAETMLLLDAAPTAATQISRRAVGRLGTVAALH